MRKLRNFLFFVATTIFFIDFGLIIYKNVDIILEAKNVDNIIDVVTKKSEKSTEEEKKDESKTTEKTSDSKVENKSESTSDNKQKEEVKNDTKSTESKSEDKKESSSKDNKKSSKMVGTYDLIDLVDNEGHYDQERINTLINYGYQAYIEFKEDNTGTMVIFLENTEFKYDDKNIYINEDSYPYSITDKELKFDRGVSQMKFQKR